MCDPWAALSRKAGLSPQLCWPGPLGQAALFRPPGELQGEVLLQPPPPRLAQSSHSAVPSWLCPLMLPLTYWVPWTEIISGCAPPPQLLTLLLHNATPRARVEYYIPERKGNAWAEKTQLQWRTLLFTTELPVSQQTQLLWSPIFQCKDCLHVFIFETSNCSVPRSRLHKGASV